MPVLVVYVKEDRKRHWSVCYAAMGMGQLNSEPISSGFDKSKTTGFDRRASIACCRCAGMNECTSPHFNQASRALFEACVSFFAFFLTTTHTAKHTPESTPESQAHPRKPRTHLNNNNNGVNARLLNIRRFVRAPTVSSTPTGSRAGSTMRRALHRLTTSQVRGRM